MKELLEYMVRLLVDHPNDVRITEVDGAKTAIFELRCHAEDIGKIIGKSGKTISAIRVILGTAAAKQGRRAMVEVVE
ncbi:MAG: KH domain-containing protein [Kiritimatiellae bacterium]|nr:KH domain-containing protein [Kiritimatiellia bacterium]